jgi:hypothetical protein
MTGMMKLSAESCICLLFVAMMTIAIAGVSCDKNAEDPCLATVSPEVSVTVYYEISTFYQLNDDESLRPLPNCQFRLDIYKLLCEGGIRGEQVYEECNTGSYNVYHTTRGYNLNTQDYIVALINDTGVRYALEGDTVIVVSEEGAVFRDEILYYMADESGGEMYHVVNAVFPATLVTEP